MHKIQVKGKKGKHWPAVKGISGNDMFLIFFDYEKKGPIERPDFYILNFEDWKKLTQKIYNNYKDERYEIELDENYRISFKKAGETKTIYPGVDIELNHIRDFKELWGKIESVATE